MNKKIKIGILFVLGLIVLWLATYFGYSRYLDYKVDKVLSLQEQETTGVEISNIKLSVDDNIYTIDEFKVLTNKPTVVKSIVTYSDSTEVTKEAYVVYDDVPDYVYVDDKYGKLVLPNEFKK